MYPNGRYLIESASCRGVRASTGRRRCTIRRHQVAEEDVYFVGSTWVVAAAGRYPGQFTVIDVRGLFHELLLTGGEGNSSAVVIATASTAAVGIGYERARRKEPHKAF